MAESLNPVDSFFKEEPIDIEDHILCKVEEDPISILSNELHPEVQDFKPLRNILAPSDNDAAKSEFDEEYSKEIFDGRLRQYEVDGENLFDSIKDEMREELMANQLADMKPQKMYKCEICDYKSNRDHNLKRHVLIHKHPSDTEMVTCDLCQYRTRHKSYLKKHLLNHKNPEEIEMLRCEYCSYSTKHKSYLRKHLWVHKDPLEYKPVSTKGLLQCEFCSYHTQFGSFLKRHMSKHRMHKCDLCDYTTRYKFYLKNHMLTKKHLK